MMRLDKFLCDNNIGTRSQVKDLVKKGLVQVNGNIVKQADYKINENDDTVVCQGVSINYQKFTYYMLNKPAGTVTAHTDALSKTVMSLLTDVNDKDLSPVGRLDKDTEGLLLITNDGELNHRLLAPKSHVPKTYFVELKASFTKKMEEELTKGVDIGEKRPCMPAAVEKIDAKKILLTIHEGKFHQVKRMLQVVGNEVTYLKRVSFGSLKLDEALEPGAYRALTEEEIKALKKDVEK